MYDLKITQTLVKRPSIRKESSSLPEIMVNWFLRKEEVETYFYE